jgi:glycosyltransferase involved in cell wall biosynthesis
LRIHHVISSVLEHFGGPSVSVPALCRELAALGHEVSLHTYAPAPAAPPDGYTHHTYRRARLAHTFGLSLSLPNGLRLAAQSGEIMHFHGMWSLPNLLPAWAVRGTSCRLVASPRGMLDDWALSQHALRKRLMWSALQGRAVRSAQLIHATAASEIAAVRALDVVVPCALVPNGVAIPEPSEIAHFGATPRTLLFLGRLDPKKAVDRLLQAWAQVQAAHPDWQLRIVGPDSEHGTSLRALAEQLGVERVSFVGPAYDRDKSRQFQAAQLFILPTHSENFGLSVAEALAHGLPVIVSRGAPWRGLLDHDCGYWIDNSVPALVACLRQALSCSARELQERGARGRVWMEREFSWRGRAHSLAEAYAWLIGAGPRPESIVEANDLNQ